MENVFTINEDFIDKLSKRIQLSASEAVKEWKTTPVFANSFLYNVVAIDFFKKLPLSIIREIIEVCFWASLEKEEGKFNNFSIVFQPPNPNDFQFDFTFKENIEFNKHLSKSYPVF